MKLEVGMKVRISKDWRSHEDYRRLEEVEDLSGIDSSSIDTEKVFEIRTVYPYPDADYLDLKGSPYTWPIGVFEVVEEEVS